MSSEDVRIWRDPRDDKVWLVRTHTGVSLDAGTHRLAVPRLISFQYPPSVNLPLKEIKSTSLSNGGPVVEISDKQLMRLLDEARGGR